MILFGPGFTVAYLELYYFTKMFFLFHCFDENRFMMTKITAALSTTKIRQILLAVLSSVRNLLNVFNLAYGYEQEITPIASLA